MLMFSKLISHTAVKSVVVMFAFLQHVDGRFSDTFATFGNPSVVINLVQQMNAPIYNLLCVHAFMNGVHFVLGQER